MSTVVGTQLRQVSNYIDEHRRAISKSRSAESHKVELIRVMAYRSADWHETKPVSTIQKKYQNHKNTVNGLAVSDNKVPDPSLVTESRPTHFAKLYTISSNWSISFSVEEKALF